MTRPSVADKRRGFRKLHEAGCFVIPNPWDVGSARYLEGLGFKALATTSSGFAWSQAHADTAVGRDTVLDHIAEIVAATDVPVNADFEGGYADEPPGVAESVRLCVETGVAGLSIEDSTGDKDKPLYDIDFAVERMKAARAAIDKTGDVMLTGRAEGFIAGRPDLDEMIARLRAYSSAGADCLYAPGLGSLDDVRTVVRAVAPKPVNVLAGSGFATVAELADAGVRRISVGGALARSALTGFLDAAREIADRGTFTRLAAAVPFATLNAAFAKPKA